MNRYRRSLQVNLRQQGAVTIIAVMLMATVVTLSILFTFKTSNTGVNDSLNQSANVAALFLAESGLEYATQQLTTGAASCGAMAVTTQSFGRGSFTIDSTATTDYDGVTTLSLSQCRIQVSGTVTESGSSIQRTLQSIVSTSAGSGVIAYDNIETRTRNNSNSASWNHLVTGSNPLLIVALSLSGNSPTYMATAVTYNGVSLTKAAERNGTGLRVELWYLMAAPAGNHGVAVTLNGTSTRFVVSSISFTGVDQTNPIEDVQSAFNNSTTISPAPQVTTISNNAWVIDALIQERDTPVPAAGASQTSLWSSTTGGVPATRITGAGSYQGPVSPAGSTAMTWSLSSSRNWAVVAAAIKPASGGSSGVLSWREPSQ